MESQAACPWIRRQVRSPPSAWANLFVAKVQGLRGMLWDVEWLHTSKNCSGANAIVGAPSNS